MASCHCRCMSALEPACMAVSIFSEIPELACSAATLDSNFADSADLPATLRDARCRLNRRSEEHTSELQSQSNLVCRLLLEKKKPPSGHTPGRVVSGRPFPL